MIHALGKPGCPYSEQAAEILEKVGLKMTWVRENHQECKENIGFRTWPQMFAVIDNKGWKLGGCSELVKFVDTGKYSHKLPEHVITHANEMIRLTN